MAWESDHGTLLHCEKSYKTQCKAQCYFHKIYIVIKKAKSLNTKETSICVSELSDHMWFFSPAIFIFYSLVFGIRSTSKIPMADMTCQRFWGPGEKHSLPLPSAYEWSESLVRSNARSPQCQCDLYRCIFYTSY